MPIHTHTTEEDLWVAFATAALPQSMRNQEDDGEVNHASAIADEAVQQHWKRYGTNHNHYDSPTTPGRVLLVRP